MKTNVSLQSSPPIIKVEDPTLTLVRLLPHPLLLREAPARVGEFVGRAEDVGRLMET
jgi:hypothetical protein